MKVIEYILKFGFQVLLGVVLIFYVPSPLIRNAQQLINQGEEVEMKEMTLSHEFNSNNYLTIRIFSNNGDLFVKNFYTPDNEHIALIKFLRQRFLINDNSINDQLPIKISGEQLLSLGSQTFILKKNESIKTLIIDKEYVIGSYPWFKIYLSYFMAFLLPLLGVLILILFAIALYKNLKAFNETGHLPELPNSIDSKIEGLKFIFRGFKEK